jgi:phage baseplate assembly protein W
MGPERDGVSGGAGIAAASASGSPHVPGWSLPLRLAEDGAAPLIRAEAVVDTARLVLEIVPGERPLLPEFGCRIHLLPVPVSIAERQVAAALMEESLDRWVPWLAAERVEVTGAGGGRIELELRANGRWHRFALAHRGPRESGPAWEEGGRSRDGVEPSSGETGWT